MPEHDFTALYEQYPAIIAQMPEVFDSHKFIRRLAQQKQALYIEALCTYRHSMHQGAVAPFRVVHQILSQRLNAHGDLVERVGNVGSEDIFGQVNECAQWRKV